MAQKEKERETAVCRSFLTLYMVYMFLDVMKSWLFQQVSELSTIDEMSIPLLVMTSTTDCSARTSSETMNIPELPTKPFSNWDLFCKKLADTHDSRLLANEWKYRVRSFFITAPKKTRKKRNNSVTLHSGARDDSGALLKAMPSTPSIRSKSTLSIRKWDCIGYG